MALQNSAAYRTKDNMMRLTLTPACGAWVRLTHKNCLIYGSAFGIFVLQLL
jgi:hypothetical protein